MAVTNVEILKVRPLGNGMRKIRARYTLSGSDDDIVKTFIVSSAITESDLDYATSRASVDEENAKLNFQTSAWDTFLEKGTLGQILQQTRFGNLDGNGYNIMLMKHFVRMLVRYGRKADDLKNVIWVMIKADPLYQYLDANYTNGQIMSATGLTGGQLSMWRDKRNLCLNPQAGKSCEDILTDIFTLHSDKIEQEL